MTTVIISITSITDTRPLMLTTTTDTLETITTTEDTPEIVIQPAMVALAPMLQTAQAAASTPTQITATVDVRMDTTAMTVL